MAELFGVLIYAGICFLCDKAGVKHNIGTVSANLLTIPINSNDIPSGIIGDACNYERKTHNEAKAQKEMRENEARQRREDERIEREAYDKLLHTIDIGNGTSYMRTKDISCYSLKDAIHCNSVINIDDRNNLTIIGNCKEFIVNGEHILNIIKTSEKIHLLPNNNRR